MYVLNVLKARTMMLVVAVVCLTLLAGCGGSDGVDASAGPATDVEPSSASDENSSEDRDEDGADGDHENDEQEEEDGADDERENDEHEEEDGADDDHEEEDDDHDEHDEDEHDDDAAAGLGAHVHGAADLFVGWSGNDVVIDLISPTNNIFGFENEPATDDELAIVSERTDLLTAPGLLVLSEQARCQLAADAETGVVFEGSHAEVTISWLYVCDNPDELRQLDLAPLFAEFPGLEDIDAQWASDTGQSAAELTANAAILRFE